MTTFDTGRRAEAAATAYLSTQGYEVLAQNWRTRSCEIDIVAKRKNIVSFVEVKYRRTAAQGLGLDYVTSKKLQQMQFAAEQWVLAHKWTGDYQLAAIEVSGAGFQIGEFIESIY